MTNEEKDLCIPRISRRLTYSCSFFFTSNIIKIFSVKIGMYDIQALRVRALARSPFPKDVSSMSPPRDKLRLGVCVCFISFPQIFSNKY